VLGDHRRYTQNSHHQEDSEEDRCNHKDRHTAPLSALCFVHELASVMAVTGGCEDMLSADFGDSLLEGERWGALRCFRPRGPGGLIQIFNL
jgi:hypothetical protein